MQPRTPTLPRDARHPAVRAVTLGGLVLGTLDLAFAMSYWAISRGTSPVRILQSIARGVLGDASFRGGAATAALGAVLHYVIATCMVLVYVLASRRLAALRRRPIVLGLLYGLGLYLVMSFVVLPLSAAGLPSFRNVLWVALSVVMHAGFGVICAIAAHFAAPRRPPTR